MCVWCAQKHKPHGHVDKLLLYIYLTGVAHHQFLKIQLLNPFCSLTYWTRFPQLSHGLNWMLKRILGPVALMPRYQAVKMNCVCSIFGLTLDSNDCGKRLLELVISKPKMQTKTATPPKNTCMQAAWALTPAYKWALSEMTASITDWSDGTHDVPW